MPEATEDNWNSTLAEFRRSNADFRQCLSQLDADAASMQTPPGRDKTIYVEVHGVIQHHSITPDKLRF